jgi:toxin FitB
VSRYLLDTNILSNPTKPAPPRALADWLSAQADDDLFIASLSLGEIWRGVQQKPAGRKRRELERWFMGPDGPQALFAGRILPSGERSGLIWGNLMAEGSKDGRPRSALNMVLAAIAQANDCTLVTANERHFAGLNFLNPLRRAG